MAAHHGEAADPDLLVWIKQILDQVLNLGPWAVVSLVGLIIAAIPISLVLLYVVQRRRAVSGPYEATFDEP